MRIFRGSRPLSKVEQTGDTMSGRGGIALFVRYITGLAILPMLDKAFARHRKRKGLALGQLFKQVLCFFMDGTSRHISQFDHYAKDPGQAAVMENTSAEMASSHTGKRFFMKFKFGSGRIFRAILNKLFEWRLRKEMPTCCLLSIDPMVMDNDDAHRRQGVTPTYKSKKGFTPLQAVWNGKIVDAIFRSGHRHGNHNDTAIHMIGRLVRIIRKTCGEHTAIIFRMDAGFFDQRIIDQIERMHVGFIMSGKILSDLKASVLTANKHGSIFRYRKGQMIWEYLELRWGCQNWKKQYRTIYTRPVTNEQGQGFFEFARPENVILTNLEYGCDVLRALPSSQQQELTSAEGIIENHHSRGADELPHRGFKEFGSEQLPFKRFTMNEAYYYCMLIAFFLHETFKEDILDGLVEPRSYATRVRRTIIDIAVRIVFKAGQYVLKVPAAILAALQFQKLWEQSGQVQPISISVK